MADRDLLFDLFALDRASAVFSKVGTEAEGLAAKIEKSNGLMNFALAGAGAIAVGFGVKAVQMAANFQESIVRLGTTAGESQANLKMVGDGILDMAGKVGYSANELANAMYDVESGGYHGATGLKVLQAAAQGARVEGANVTDVAHALTGALNDYRGTNLSAIEATNAMTAAVGSGMMRFQDLAEAMPKIGARAAAAHVSFEEMLAAVGTMTADGLPAAVAATYLGQTIGQLAAPTAKASKEMKGLGIDSTALAATMTSGSGHGLGDAIKMLYDGIQKHLVGGGLVSVDTFAKMSKSTTDFQQVLAKLPPGTQTVVQALANASGGVKAFQGVLMLGGQHADQYAQTLANVQDQVKKGGDEVAGFTETQKNLNAQLRDAEAAAGAFAIKMGNELLPFATDTAEVFKGFFNLLSDNEPVVMGVVGGVAAFAAAFGTLKGVMAGATAIQAAFTDSAMLLNIQLAGTALATEGITSALGFLKEAFMTNPIGILATVVGTAVGALVWFNTKSDETKQKADEQRQKIDALSQSYTGLADSIDDATKKSAFNELGKKGAITAGTTLGVGSKTLVDATFGDPASIKKVSDAISVARTAFKDFMTDEEVWRLLNGQATQSEQDYADKLRTAYNAANDLSGALSGVSKDFAQNATDNRQAALATGQMQKAVEALGLSAPDAAQLLSGPLAHSVEDVTTQIQKMGPNFHLTSDQIQGILKAEMIPGVDSELTLMGSIVEKDLANASTKAQAGASKMGDAFIQGFTSALMGGQGVIHNLVSGMGASAVGALGQGIGAHSPSRKTMEMGRHFTSGFVLGVNSGGDATALAARGMANRALGGLSSPTLMGGGISSKASKKAELAEAILTALQGVHLKLDTQTNTLRVT